MLYIPYFDTVYLSIKCDFDVESDIFEKINKNLSFCFEDDKDCFDSIDDEKERIAFVKEGLLHSSKYVMGKFYNAMYENKNLGIKVWRNPKHNVKNYPIYIELDGLFFHYFALSHLFLKFLFNNYGDILYFSRVDVRYDIVYMKSEYLDLLDIPGSLDTFNVPAGFPLISYKLKSGVSSHAPIESHCYFNENTKSFLLDTLFSGRYDRKIKVYDKNLDLNNKNSAPYEVIYDSYLKDYCDNVDDYKDCRVFRIELMLRGQDIKNYYKNFLNVYSVAKTVDIDIVFLESLLRYMHETFDFDIEAVNKSLSVFKYVESFSCYVKDDVKKLADKVTDCENKIRREVNRLLSYEDDYKRLLSNGLNLVDDWSDLEFMRTDFDRRFLDIDFEKVKDLMGGVTRATENSKESEIVPF